MRWLTVNLTFIITVIGQCQTIKEFKYLGDPYANNSYVGAAYSKSYVSNPGVVNSNAHRKSDGFAELNFKCHNFDIKGFRYDLDTKLYWDLIRITSNLVQGDFSQYYRDEGTGLSTGLTGWHTLAWNAISTPKFVLATGFNHHDYFYGSSVRDESELGLANPKLQTFEPQGYYFTAGPSVLGDILLHKWFLVHLKGSYSIAYWKPTDITYAIKDPTYPMPHFWGLSVELTVPIGLFLEMDHNQIINRGDLPTKGRRTDFNIGFKFVLD